jgi:hypothetical protein
MHFEPGNLHAHVCYVYDHEATAHLPACKVISAATTHDMSRVDECDSHPVS